MSKQPSNLLIDEPSPQVVPSLAVTLGINAAIFTQQVHFWCRQAERQGDKHKYIDGKWWTYNTAAEWQKQMPWLTVDGIRKIVKYLKDKDIILVAKHGSNSYDHTLWYAINHDEVNKLSPSLDEGENDVVLSTNSEVVTSTDSDVVLSTNSIVTSESPTESQSENSPEGADAAAKEEKSDRPKSKNDHTGKLIDDLEELGFYLDRDEITKLSGNFGSLKKKGVSHEELVRVRMHMVAEWPRYPMTPQKALTDVRREPRNSQPDNVTQIRSRKADDEPPTEAEIRHKREDAELLQRLRKENGIA